MRSKRNPIIEALGLPTTYRRRQLARGHLRDKRYVEVAALHSGTGGHTRAFARFLDGAWKEISAQEFDRTIREIFEMDKAPSSPGT